MKKLKDELKTKLLNRRGETLVESIISIMILTMVFASITAMLAMSLRMIGDSIAERGRNQVNINNTIMENTVPDPASITLSGTAEIQGELTPITVDIDVAITVDVFGEGGFVAFSPGGP